MKNVLIDIPDLSKEHGGVYQYSIALLKVLNNNIKGYNFFVLCYEPDEQVVDISNNNLNITICNENDPKYSRLSRLFYRGVNVLFSLLKLSYRWSPKDKYDIIVSKYQIDIIHSPTQKNVNKPNVKSITTLHDVQELHFPEFFTSGQRATRAVNFKKAVDNADAVIVSYNHVNDDIVEYFHKPKHQVHTVLLDMKDLWFSKIKVRDSKVLDKFNLPDKYLLYPAATWEHKNHLNLIKAINELKEEGIYLICTGHKTAFYNEKIEPYISANKLDERIKFIGIVSDQELFELYKNCQAVVVPTLYEAGSFPLMESILLGVPVICSNVTSLPETIGDNEFVFDPQNISDIKDKVKLIWSDEAYRAKNLALAQKQKMKLVDNNAADKIYKIYKSILHG